MQRRKTRTPVQVTDLLMIIAVAATIVGGLLTL